MDIGSVL